STALVCAATGGHVDAAKLLIARGTNLERRAGWGLSALHQAVSWEQLEMVKALLDAGAQIDGTTDDGTTSLMIAAARGNLPIVRLSMDRRATRDGRDSRGWNAWACATEKCEDEVAAFLAQAGAEAEFPPVSD